jgi:glutathione S-transferase
MRAILCAPGRLRKQADMSELTLVIGNKNYSSWSLRPWIAMKTLGIDFRETMIPFDFEGGNTAIKAVSGSGKVPMLIDGDLKIWESLAILEYFAERFPERNVWPADAARRAVARSVASEMATGFFALRGPIRSGRRCWRRAAALFSSARFPRPMPCSRRWSHGSAATN